MARTEITSASPQRVQRWSTMFASQVLADTAMGRFVADGPLAIVRRVTDLTGTAGDVIKLDLRQQNRAFGVWGTDRMQGNENSLTYFQQSVGIDLLRHGDSYDIMSQQRTIHDLNRESRDDVTQNYADTVDTLFHTYMCGATFDSNLTSRLTSSVGFAGNFLLTPDSNHVINRSGDTVFSVASAATEASQLSHLKRAKATAKNMHNIGTGLSMIRPGRMGRNVGYVYLMHPYAVFQMINATGATDWTTLVSNAEVRGRSNPLFTGNGVVEFRGVYDGTFMFESSRVPYDSTNTNTYNLFLGANSGWFVGGNAVARLGVSTDGMARSAVSFAFKELEDDGGIIKSVHALAILGIQRAYWNSTNYGSIHVLANDAAP